MTRNLPIEPPDFDQILSQGEKHFADATEIWNKFGVTSPQLRADATRAARSIYTKAAELLDPDRVRNLPQINGYVYWLFANVSWLRLRQ